MLALWLMLAVEAHAGLRIAVVEFTNAADDHALDSLGKGLQSMLTTDLSGVEQVELVERSRLTEIQDELKLTQQNWVDPATAAKVGKLAGASHLLGGSFTVVGKSMRLDARIFEVQSGKVLLAEALTGERDAFFELEKNLVDRLITTLNVELSPKERASVRRLHTADFGAFEEFSKGIDAMDDKRYDEALASLGGAVAADEDFKLAKITLEQYGEIIAKIRARADALDADEAARDRLAKLASDREDAQIVAKLTELATKQGAAAQKQRIAALHLLALMYDSELQHQDRFVRQRGRDAYVQRYFAEAEPLWPKLPLFPRATSNFGPDIVKLETFDQDFVRYTRMVWEGDPGSPEEYWPKTRPNFVKNNIGERIWIDYLAQYLYLDQRDEVELHERSFKWLAAAGDPLDLENDQDRARLRAQAKRLTKLSAFDESTALLKRLADTTDDGSAVRSLAEDIATNGELKGMISGLAEPKLEFARLSIADGGSYLDQRLQAWSGEGLKHLTSRRRLDDCGLDTNNHAPTWVDGHPVWTMQREASLFTGPRSDPKRAVGLRYYQRPPYRPDQKPPADSMLFIDGVPRGAVRIGFVLSSAVPSDFADPDSRSSELSSAAPIVDVLIGFHDLRTPEITDSVTREIVEKSPPAGFAVRLHPDRVELVKRDAVWERSNQVDEWTEVVLESASVKKGKKHEVEVEVKGTSVAVTVDGSKQKWTAKELERGFYGFGFRGEGMAVIDGLAVAQPD